MACSKKEKIDLSALLRLEFYRKKDLWVIGGAGEPKKLKRGSPSEEKQENSNQSDKECIKNAPDNEPAITNTVDEETVHNNAFLHCRSESQCEQLKPQNGQPVPELEQLAAQYDGLTASYEQVTAEFEQLAAHYDQLSVPYGQMADKFEQLAAQYDQLTTPYGQMTDDFEELAAHYNQQLTPELLSSPYERFFAGYDQFTGPYERIAAPYDESTDRLPTEQEQSSSSSRYEPLEQLREVLEIMLPQDLLCLAETWLSAHQEHHSYFDEYELEHSDEETEFARGVHYTRHSSMLDINYALDAAESLKHGGAAWLTSQQLTSALKTYATAIRILLAESVERTKLFSQGHFKTTVVSPHIAYEPPPVAEPFRGGNLTGPRGRGYGRGRGFVQEQPKVIGIRFGRPYRIQQ